MHPDLFTIPGTSIKLHSYGLMIMLGFVGAVWLAGRNAAKAKTDKDTLIDLGIFSMVIGILCAKINYVLQYPENYEGSWAPFDLTDGNLSVIGAVVLAPLPYVVWLWKTRKAQAPMRGRTLLAIAALTVVMAVVGARGWYLATHTAEYHGKWKFLEDWRSGFVLYGGLIGGIGAGMLFVLWKKLSILNVGDIMAPGIALGVGIGRIGCFLQGCCWGKSWDGPWAVRFPRESSFYGYLREQGKVGFDDTHTPLVHPTQLYEAVACIAMAMFLLFLIKRRRHYGEVLVSLGIMYSVWRFLLEMMRTDPRPTYWGGMTYSQWVGILVFIFCAFALYVIKTRGREVEPEPTPAPAKP